MAVIEFTLEFAAIKPQVPGARTLSLSLVYNSVDLIKLTYPFHQDRPS